MAGWPVSRTGGRLLVAALLAGSAHADTFVRDDILTAPTPRAFSVCFGHGCAEVAQLALSTDRWHDIESLFEPPAADAESERRQIARAVARMEQLAGALTGTQGDLGGNRRAMSADADPATQLDCIDESTNSTTYLRMFQQAGLMHWHRVEDRVTRGFFLFGWPHTTAVIRDEASGMRYAVDSWFHDNGIEPAIIELTAWEDGWEP